jgi:hypothetical protein
MAGNEGAFLLKSIGDLETRTLQRQLADIAIEAPVFITGLARSGTTILLSVLASLPGFATHRYADFPFVFTPVFWSRYLARFARPAAATERPHRDGIRITADSPDAFEEPLWQYFFPQLHDRNAVHTLDQKTSAPAFEKFFADHLRKILLLRGGTRYLSKGNYNISRIAYLARLFPSARFVIPVRHPLDHVESLVRQHWLFSGYAQTDARIGRYLQAAGHYEFGPQRIPVNLGAGMARETLEHWKTGHEHSGYAVQWQGIYQYALALKETPALQDRIMIVRFEDLCAEPAATLQRVLEFIAVDDAAVHAIALATHISQPRSMPDVADASAGAIRHITARAAAALDYRH